MQRVVYMNHSKDAPGLDMGTIASMATTWTGLVAHFGQVLQVGVFDTLSDSIQCLNFAQMIQFNIWFNIALLKIQFKISFNSKKILMIQFKDISIQ